MTIRKAFSLLALAAAITLGAVQTAVAKDGAPKDTVTTIAKELICLCPHCGKQSLDQCAKCGEGQKHRGIIAAQLKEGKTKSEIIAYFADTYGNQVLGNPRPEGFNRSAVMLPAAAALLGLIPLTLILRRRRQISPPAAAAPGVAASPAAEDPRIAAALKDLKF